MVFGFRLLESLCGQEFGFGRRAGIAKDLEFKRESPFDPDRTHYKS